MSSVSETLMRDENVCALLLRSHGCAKRAHMQTINSSPRVEYKKKTRRAISRNRPPNANRRRFASICSNKRVECGTDASSNGKHEKITSDEIPQPISSSSLLISEAIHRHGLHVQPLKFTRSHTVFSHLSYIIAYRCRGGSPCTIVASHIYVLFIHA